MSEAEIDGRPYCLVTVSDNGVGIPDDLQQHVFDSFVTGKRIPQYSTSIGLGLHIVKHTMGLHHGFVTLTSRVGEGSRFVLHIPVGLSHFVPGEYEMVPDPVKGDLLEECTTEERPMEEVIAEKNETMEETVNRVKNNKEFLLIIEDHDEMREYLCSLFKEDYNVIEAGNGEEGVAMADKYIPKLIISDIMMPEMDGIEFCKYVKGHLEISHIPVILLTAKNKEEDRAEAYEIGADAFISKPFNLTVLHARIRNLLKYKARMAHDFKNQIVFEVKDLNYTSLDEDFIQRAINCVNNHLEDPNFDQAQFADEMLTSKSTLYKKLKSLAGLNTSSFIRNVRLKAACRIMEEKGINIRVSELAYAVGFNDPKYFSSCFKKEFGMLPSEYIERFIIEKEKD